MILTNSLIDFIAPNHSRLSCNDINLYNNSFPCRCARCILFTYLNCEIDDLPFVITSIDLTDKETVKLANLRQTALAKLTQEEIKALGVK